MDTIDIRQAVAAEVRAALAREGQSQAWLSARAGISRSPLALKLRGQRSLTVEELVAIAAALDVDPATILATWAAKEAA